MRPETCMCHLGSIIPCHLDSRLYVWLDPGWTPKNSLTKSQQIIFSTSANIRPISMNLFSPRNVIFEVARGQNNKFVTVGVPGAETGADFILFTSLSCSVIPQPPPGSKFPKFPWWNLFRGSGGREALTITSVV